MQAKVHQNTANYPYPFGTALYGRDFSFSSGYKYGFNGKEKDDEIKGAGNSQDYGARIYDPRSGKFFSIDPLFKKYPELSTYQFASNRPIDGIDLDGLEHKQIVYQVQDGKTTVLSTTIYKEDLNNKHGTEVMFLFGNGKAKVDYLPSKNDAPKPPEKGMFEKLGDAVGNVLDASDRFILNHQGSTIGGGSADGANMGTCDKQDVAVGGGIIGAMTGVGAIIEGAAVIGGAVGLAFSADDIATNPKGEGFLEAHTDNQTMKAVINGVKTLYSAKSAINSIKDMTKLGVTAYKALDAASSTAGAVTGAVSTAKSTKDAVKGAVKKEAAKGAAPKEEHH